MRYEIYKTVFKSVKRKKKTKIKTKSTANGQAHPTPARPITAWPASAPARVHA
jgi:hypothetical protein